MRFICYYPCKHIFNSTQINEDDGIIEGGGGVLYDSKTACSVLSLVPKFPKCDYRTKSLTGSRHKSLVGPQSLCNRSFWWRFGVVHWFSNFLLV